MSKTNSSYEVKNTQCILETKACEDLNNASYENMQEYVVLYHNLIGWLNNLEEKNIVLLEYILSNLNV